MRYLLVDHVLGIVLDPFAAIALFGAGVHLVGVWSKLMIKEHGILFSSMVLTIIYEYDASISFRTGSDILTLPCVPYA